MTDQFPPICSLDPKIPEDLTVEERLILWMEVMENPEQLVLNRLRDEVGPDGNVLAAYRR